MSASASAGSRRQVVQELRARIATLEGAPATGTAIPTHPQLAGLIGLRGGASYTVDCAALVLPLLAEPSAAGEWVAVVGWPDLGVEAALEWGADLSKVVLVPDPGEHWLEVSAALADVVRLVVLRLTEPVPPARAGVLAARLRKRSTALVVWGDWPGCEARLSLQQGRWSGPQRGAGRLVQRRAQLVVQRGMAPPASAEWVTGEAGPTTEQLRDSEARSA